MAELDPPQFTSGLILTLPELAEFTSPWRSTSYAPDSPTLPIERRFPPHLTLLTPWADRDDAEALSRLRDVASRHRPLEVELDAAERFPGTGVVWLRPVPHDGLAALLTDVLAAFPEYPPYGGLHPEPTLHVTVSADGDDDVLADVRRALAAAGRLHAPVTQISVYARDEDDIWRAAHRVPLGPPA